MGYSEKLLFSLVCVLIIKNAHLQSHDHDHDHEPSEPAAYKYSKQVNEAAAKGPEVTTKAPAAHAHSHGGAKKDEHAHSHGGAKKEEHAHSHGSAKNEEHAHSHGGAKKEQHAHSHGSAKKEQNAHSHGSESKHAHSGEDRAFKASSKGSVDYTLWLKAIGATLLISISPVLILLLIPVEDANEKHQPLLKVLLAFASGGLLGDAFLHLIPHAISPHSHSEEGHSHSSTQDHGHSHGLESHHMQVGMWVLAGIIAFLCVEKFVRIVKGDHSHSHSHSHSKPPAKPKAKEDKVSKEKLSDDEKSEEKADSDKAEQSEDKKEEESEEEEETVAEKKENLRIAGYLNLAADFAHNFTDGLAIGASFLAGHTIGIVTTVTVLLHEIPHEIGDFAILVQSGCSKKKAMMLQFTTAIGALCGTLLSLSAGGINNESTLWVLPFTAGGFIYIATVSVIPELLEDTKLGQSIKEVVALLVGVLMMIIIAQYE